MGVAKIMCNIGLGDGAQECKVYGWLEVADWCESLLLHLSFSWSVLKKKCLCLIYEFRRNCVCKVYQKMQLPVLKCERVGIQDCSYSVKNMYKQNIFVSGMAGIGVNQLDLWFVK